MDEEKFQRKLTAILSADVAGYSRLMRDDEAATVRTITAHKKALTRLIQQYRGRVVDSPGDNLLADDSKLGLEYDFMDEQAVKNLDPAEKSRSGVMVV
jgi:class 3 adenylate cyclase